jgi:hypothetical protein
VEDLSLDLDDAGKPRLLKGERVLAAEMATLLHPGHSALQQPGTIVVTTHRLVYIPPLPQVPIALPLCRVVIDAPSTPPMQVRWSWSVSTIVCC